MASSRLISKTGVVIEGAESYYNCQNLQVQRSHDRHRRMTLLLGLFSSAVADLLKRLGRKSGPRLSKRILFPRSIPSVASCKFCQFINAANEHSLA